jgi:hypothetical protein
LATPTPPPPTPPPPLKELDGLGQMGVVFFGINLGVGIRCGGGAGQVGIPCRGPLTSPNRAQPHVALLRHLPSSSPRSPSVALPGFASDLAHGLLGEMPFGAITLVGAKGMEDARKARLSGADSILIKKEMWEAAEKEGRPLETLVEQVRYLTGGDD